jgi:aminoglycoside 6'-N-acetyltransferase I
VSIRIRPVGPADRDAWAAMRCALWPDEDPAELGEEVDRHLAGEPGVADEVLVAEREDGALVAMAELAIRDSVDGCRSRGVAYLEAWWVAPELRRSGVGRRLVEAAAEWGRSRGCTEMGSDTEVSNEVSRQAHRACGFEEVATVHQFRMGL